jgi:uncharacterized membrane protein
MLKFFGSLAGIRALFRRHFLTGVLVLIPFAVVAWIFVSVFSFFLTLKSFFPQEWQPEHYFSPTIASVLNFFTVILISILFVLAISLLGWISKQVIGASFLRMMSRWIERIPVVRSIYSSLNQLLRTMASGDNRQFNRVVYLEYPRKGTWVLAFVTGPARAIEESQIYLNVYVPTTPNPTSGFHLIVNEKEVRDSHLSVEEAFKTILSLGIAQ